MTQKVDCWSLGCVLGELLGPPFSAFKDLQLKQIVAFMVERTTPYNLCVYPADVKGLIQRLLNYEPNTRLSAGKSNAVCHLADIQVTSNELNNTISKQQAYQTTYLPNNTLAKEHADS